MHCTRWLDGVKKACSARLQELRDAEVSCMDREQWRVFVNGARVGVNVWCDREYLQHKPVKEWTPIEAITVTRTLGGAALMTCVLQHQRLLVGSQAWILKNCLKECRCCEFFVRLPSVQFFLCQGAFQNTGDSVARNQKVQHGTLSTHTYVLFEIYWAGAVELL